MGGLVGPCGGWIRVRLVDGGLVGVRTRELRDCAGGGTRWVARGWVRVGFVDGGLWGDRANGGFVGSRGWGWFALGWGIEELRREVKWIGVYCG